MTTSSSSASVIVLYVIKSHTAALQVKVLGEDPTISDISETQRSKASHSFLVYFNGFSPGSVCKRQTRNACVTCSTRDRHTTRPRVLVCMWRPFFLLLAVRAVLPAYAVRSRSDSTYVCLGWPAVGGMQSRTSVSRIAGAVADAVRRSLTVDGVLSPSSSTGGTASRPLPSESK